MAAYRLGSPLPSVNDFIRLEVIVAGTAAGRAYRMRMRSVNLIVSAFIMRVLGIPLV